MTLRVGVISDTHGLLRPQAVEALRGSNRIIHAGDVGDPGILKDLERIAPTTCVRGNVDMGPWAEALPLREVVEVGNQALYVVHRMEDLDVDPAAGGFAAVITGHTHRPAAETRDAVLYLNPGSAGPRRFDLPIALARLIVTEADLRHEILEL